MPPTPPALVSPPTRQPSPFGLFSVSVPRPNGTDRWESGVQWESANCDPLEGVGSWEPPVGAGTTGLPKALDPSGPIISEATPFTVYAHFRCSPVGWTPDSAQQMAEARLYAREEARVEQAVWTSDLGNTSTLRGAAELNGGTATTIQDGIGLLEEYLAANYGGLGAIHLTARAAPQVAEVMRFTVSGTKMFTMTGTPVIVGNGYDGSSPAGVAAAAGTSWAYITPVPFHYRSEVFTSSNRAGDLLDKTVNNLFAVAERNYVVGFDPCGVSAVQLQLA